MKVSLPNFALHEIVYGVSLGFRAVNLNGSAFLVVLRATVPLVSGIPLMETVTLRVPETALMGDALEMEE